MNQNLRQERKMNGVQLNHLIIDFKRKSEDPKNIQEINFQTQIEHQGKDLIVVYCMHIVWSVGYILRQLVLARRRRRWKNDIPTCGEKGTWGNTVENHCFR